MDFVMEFYGKSFPEAVQMLTGEPGEAQPEADPAPSPAFRLPLRNVTNANILNYLTQERKLSPSLVNFFIAAGNIYEDSSHHNVVFVGRDADGHPRYASSRGIQEKFRQDAAGAEKAFGFAHRGTDKQLLVFEAPIDLLSFIELFPKNWQQHNYLSLGGVSARALQQFLSERPDVERVFLCLDADKAGEDACKRLAGLLPDTVSVTRIQPCMKDWNDVLVHRAEIPNRNYFKSIVLKEPPKKDSVKIIRMSDVELTPVEWLWKPYLPFGKLSVLQGNPGEGKTYFAMHLAAACTNGKLLPNMEHMEPFNVIYQTAEDGLGDTVKPRLIEAGADLDRVLVIDDSEVQLTLSDERIEKAIIENNARLVIIDPIQAYLGADVDMNRANEVRPIFMRLGQVAQRTGCAILLIEEMQKRVDAATARYHELGDSIKAAETRMAEIAVLRTHIVNYARTRPVYDAYRKAGYSKKFLGAHREEITLHKAAKAAFDEAGLKKLPKAKDLSIEYAELLKKKKEAYPDYRKARDEMQELMKAQKNVEIFFAEKKSTTEKEQIR